MYGLNFSLLFVLNFRPFYWEVHFPEGYNDLINILMVSGYEFGHRIKKILSLSLMAHVTHVYIVSVLCICCTALWNKYYRTTVGSMCIAETHQKEPAMLCEWWLEVRLWGVAILLVTALLVAAGINNLRRADRQTPKQLLRLTSFGCRRPHRSMIYICSNCTLWSQVSMFAIHPV